MLTFYHLSHDHTLKVGFTMLTPAQFVTRREILVLLVKNTDFLFLVDSYRKKKKREIEWRKLQLN